MPPAWAIPARAALSDPQPSRSAALSTRLRASTNPDTDHRPRG